MNDSQLQHFIEQVFNAYDRDQNGFLSGVELANFFNDVFAHMGSPTRFNTQQAAASLKLIDQNNDGRASKP